jgi:hypothetical protein
MFSEGMRKPGIEMLSDEMGMGILFFGRTQRME